MSRSSVTSVNAAGAGAAAADGASASLALRSGDGSREAERDPKTEPQMCPRPCMIGESDRIGDSAPVGRPVRLSNSMGPLSSYKRRPSGEVVGDSTSGRGMRRTMSGQ